VVIAIESGGVNELADNSLIVQGLVMFLTVSAVMTVEVVVDMTDAVVTVEPVGCSTMTDAVLAKDETDMSVSGLAVTAEKRFVQDTP